MQLLSYMKKVQPTVDYIGVTRTVGGVWVCRRFDYSHFRRRFGVAVLTIDLLERQRIWEFGRVYRFTCLAKLNGAKTPFRLLQDRQPAPKSFSTGIIACNWCDVCELNSMRIPLQTLLYRAFSRAIVSSGADSMGHGGTCPHFYKWLGTGGPWVEEQQTRNWLNCTDNHESAHQSD